MALIQFKMMGAHHYYKLCVSAIIIIKEEANTNPQKSEMDAYDLARMSWQIFVTIEGHDCWVLIVVVDVGKRNCPALDDWLNFSDFNELIKYSTSSLCGIYVMYYTYIMYLEHWEN